MILLIETFASECSGETVTESFKAYRGRRDSRGRQVGQFARLSAQASSR